MSNEAEARLRINQLLTESGWRLLDTSTARKNVQVEESTQLGDSKHGFLDYLLLDPDGYPFVVLEAKKSSVHPLAAKEQTRAYAASKNCDLVILSNGDSHYLWDVRRGDPRQITKLPTQEELLHRQEYEPNPLDLGSHPVDSRYLPGDRALRDYQVAAIRAIQKSVQAGQDRFLLEMATGTGKTTTAAAICKLFLETGNAKRILFLVDRIELETQAVKSVGALFKGIYFVKSLKDKDWSSAHIVVSTMQTLLAGNRYRDLFSPINFELVISDEAHRGLSGNSRAVFEYFIGYKLGLTATPKNYLKGVDAVALSHDNPQALERRNLRDTYKTFGCEKGRPTYRYDLNAGVQDGYLLPPKVLDIRSEVTTQLLSEEGFVVDPSDIDDEQQVYRLKQFERRFFNERTNILFARTILEQALRDPFTGEAGKTVVFCVSQNHAAKITQALNLLAAKRWPGMYESDFAMQITSAVGGAQEYTEQFADNKLSGRSRFGQDKFPDYVTSKTRVCVTVGMMTTGYDCPDLLNVALLRPIYSPSNFIQMKGRGTRRHNFVYQETGEERAKTHFLLFDFFANCEYFEEGFDYDEKLTLPSPGTRDNGDSGDQGGTEVVTYDAKTQDQLAKTVEITIDEQGMRIDRDLYPHPAEQFAKVIQEHPSLEVAREAQDIEAIARILQYEIFDRPSEYWNAQKIRSSYLEQEPEVKRKITLTEMILRALGVEPRFKTRPERISEEYKKFVEIKQLEVTPPEANRILKVFFETYLADPEFREIMQKGEFARLTAHPVLTTAQISHIKEYRQIVTDYIDEYLVREKDEFEWS